jgi:hypothetical protein
MLPFRQALLWRQMPKEFFCLHENKTIWLLLRNVTQATNYLIDSM